MIGMTPEGERDLETAEGSGECGGGEVEKQQQIKKKAALVRLLSLDRLDESVFPGT